MACDPYRSSVVLALHMDGTNGSTTFTDSSPSAKTVTANGNAQISTAQSKFGGASGYFDGVGDYLSLTGDSFSTGDFTIEGWMYLTALSKTSPLFDSRAADNDTAGLVIYIRSTTNKLTVGTGNPFVATEGTTTLTTGWHHVAVVKVGGSIKAYLNGNLELTVANASSLANTSWKIGNTWNAAGDGAIYIDDLRITKGVARYTANFTAPTAAFPDNQCVISGVVGSPGNYLERMVRAYRRDTGALIGQAVSNPTTGAYSISAQHGGECFAIVHDSASIVSGAPIGGTNNAIIYDRLTPA